MSDPRSEHSFSAPTNQSHQEPEDESKADSDPASWKTMDVNGSERGCLENKTGGTRSYRFVQRIHDDATIGPLFYGSVHH
jgi:hypothetical protein